MALDQQIYGKKLQRKVAERNLMVRDGWMVFLDESAANERTSDRKYGWAQRGVRAAEYIPINDRNCGRFFLRIPRMATSRIKSIKVPSI